MSLTTLLGWRSKLHFSFILFSWFSATITHTIKCISIVIINLIFILHFLLELKKQIFKVTWLDHGYCLFRFRPKKDYGEIALFRKFTCILGHKSKLPRLFIGKVLELDENPLFFQLQKEVRLMFPLFYTCSTFPRSTFGNFREFVFLVHLSISVIRTYARNQKKILKCRACFMNFPRSLRETNSRQVVRVTNQLNYIQ